jgi:murein DD-endopeptidase MepM/ murein hydrolase activator NlpD
MKLIKPEGILTQPFGANANPSYKGAGLKGHSGEDYTIGFKKDIRATVTGEVYSLLNIVNPDPDKYRAVFQIIDEPDFSYEVSYGHIVKAYVYVGQIVKAGELIATEGNYGTSYSNGILVTADQKATGKGTHLHFQVRKCIRVKKKSSKKQYLKDANGFLKRNEFFYEVVDYDNGYNGCVDPAQFYGNKPKFQFTRDLTIGDKGEDVTELQKFLNSKGFIIAQSGVGSKENETDYFGSLTRDALIKYQESNNIQPAVGFFGPLTRSKFNSS